MYVPRKFMPPSPELITKFIKDNGFATLISAHEGQIIGSHIPLVLEQRQDEYILVGHLSRANEQHQMFDGTSNLMAVFMEQHTYISSSWYDHINVPTWNYIAVHVYGKAHVIEGEALVQSLKNLVNQYEEGNKNPFTVAQMPEQMLQREVRGIVGFEMKIEKIEASYKLSQNRDDKNYSAIISKLEERGDEFSLKIAQDMRNIR